jgi:hypothetical protein
LKYPLFSNKKQRLFLTEKYYDLKDLKAYSASEDSSSFKA